MQTVCDLINQGASLAASYQSAEAMSMFMEADLALRAIVSSNPDIQQHALNPSLLSLDVVPIPFQGQPGINIFVCGKDLDDGCTTATGPTNHQKQGTATQIEPCDVVLSMALLNYNMAVTLQLQEEGGAEAKQKRTYKLYCDCLQLLRLLSDVEEVIPVVRLSVASFYNMANLLFDMEIFDRASAMVNHFQNLLEVAMLNHHHHTTTTTVSGIGGSLPLFHDETMLAFASTAYFIPYGASLSRPAPAA